jgi:hypothetical protein
MTRLQRNILIAATLFVGELVIGIGIIGGSGILIAIVVLLTSHWNKKAIIAESKVALIYAALFGLTIAFLVKTGNDAKRNAGPVIAACKQFRQKYQRYPTTLGELIPEFIPAIPNARPTLIGRRFVYAPARPQLYFVAMFHGIYAHDFPQDRWFTND